jgi:hypothetical protein
MYCLTSQLKEEIKQLKNDTMSEFLRELTNESSTEYSLWKINKNLKRPITQALSIKKLDGSWARNNEQKALRFAEHLENVLQPNTPKNNEVLSDVFLQDSVEIPLTSPTEVKRY